MQGEDAELVKRYLRGEKQAVATVDSWIAHAAYPYKRRLAHRWDDVLQEIRLEVTKLLKQDKFRGESSLKTYLWRVVSHTCLDQINADSRVKRTEIDPGEDPEERSFSVVSPDNESPDARLEVKDLLLRVLDRVPADCRELWRMIHAGLSYREMSTRLGVAEGTLRVRVLRCRERAVAVRAELLRGAAV